MNVRVVCERDILPYTQNLTERLRPAVAWTTFSPMLESLLNRYSRGFQRYMPTPLSIALLLTLAEGLHGGCAGGGEATREGGTGLHNAAAYEVTEGGIGETPSAVEAERHSQRTAGRDREEIRAVSEIC